MINIVNKQDCCGCSACEQICPKQCISLYEDEKGFLYPHVNSEDCINCGLCEKVCLKLHPYEIRTPYYTYAATNDNEEIRMRSSSGGIFTLFAEQIIDEGGVVFGARFDENWQVTLDYTETKEGLAAFRGSKYVQSRIGDTFRQCELFLKSGRRVMFTGTPCQVSGLKHFLRKEYDNLLLVDFVCHGVPSPLVWRDYLNQLVHYPDGVARISTILASLKEKPIITSISFRDKSTGWKQFSFVVRGVSGSKVQSNTVLPSDDDIIFHEPHNQNLYMQLFLKNLCLRPSCSNCPAKSGKSGSDITIADYWGISKHHPQWDDDKGTSLILVNSRHGVEYYQQLNINYIETSYEQALAGNPSIEHSVHRTRYVSRFWKSFSKEGILGAHKVLLTMRPTYFQRLKIFLFRRIYKFPKI